MSNDALDVAGNVIGYIYTVAWGVSFLGQIYENWKLKKLIIIHIMPKSNDHLIE